MSVKAASRDSTPIENRGAWASASLACMGIVFGDIWTSPLDGDLLSFWRHGDSNASVLLRNNAQIQNNRGSVKINWGLRITRVPNLDNVTATSWINHELRFYVRFFTGYGETLVDYNLDQSTIDIGIMLSDWMQQ